MIIKFVTNPCMQKPYELHLYRDVHQLWPHEVLAFDSVVKRLAVAKELREPIDIDIRGRYGNDIVSLAHAFKWVSAL